ncbi:hypothetical protein BJ170DRAFT_591148 [Xylariales sp. AK1849]|nr:hypothetical protein BJ170DRAFT_591148 [Xylariales sp. AK1849]
MASQKDAQSVATEFTCMSRPSVGYTAEASSSQARQNPTFIWWGSILRTHGNPQLDPSQPSVVEVCKLDWKPCEYLYFKDFNGKRFKTTQRVKLTWAGRDDKTYEGDFYVAPPRSDIGLTLGDDFVSNEGARKRSLCNWAGRARYQSLIEDTQKEERGSITANEAANEWTAVELDKKRKDSSPRKKHHSSSSRQGSSKKSGSSRETKGSDG